MISKIWMISKKNGARTSRQEASQENNFLIYIPFMHHSCCTEKKSSSFMEFIVVIGFPRTKLSQIIMNICLGFQNVFQQEMVKKKRKKIVVFCYSYILIANDRNILHFHVSDAFIEIILGERCGNISNIIVICPSDFRLQSPCP